jgi:hypothetical protein
VGRVFSGWGYRNFRTIRSERKAASMPLLGRMRRKYGVKSKQGLGAPTVSLLHHTIT